jgi:hypothetical protein
MPKKKEIRPLGFLKSIRLDELEARGLIELFLEVFTRPQDHRPLSSAWDDFLGLQKIVATRIRYTDWIR